MTIEFTVRGTPKPQPRPRAAWRKGMKRAQMYEPGTAEEWKSLIFREAEGHVPLKPLEGPLYVWMHFRFKRPKSHFGTGKNADVLKPNAPFWHGNTPDLDNLAKAVMDACTQLGLWGDDRQIVELGLKKTWGDTGGMQIYVGERALQKEAKP